MTLDSNNKIRITAAVITFILLLFILFILFVGKVGWNRDALAAFSEPQDGQEEIFLEPELLTEQGSVDEAEISEPEAPAAGLPEQAEVKSTEVAEVSPDPVQSPPRSKLVTQNKPSPVNTPEPVGQAQQKKAADNVASKFNQVNGSVEGKFNAAGSAGTAVGVAGSMNGRTFLGCPSPDVTLAHKTVVKVSITVDALGRVTSASAQGGASADIRKACEQAARQARWSEKPGTPSTRGSITFTITPR